MRARARLTLALIVLGLLAAFVAACGDLEDAGGDGSRGDLTTGATSTGADGSATPKQDLPPLQSGQVLVDGQLAGSLTQQLTDDFRANAARRGVAINPAATDDDPANAFASLCSGRIDLVDASRRITDAELAACGDNGLQVVDFQIAFDATVVATRNERDVGADCVNFDQLRAMFAAGTPVSAWNQLNPNFFPVELSTTGPIEDSSNFQFFGQRVLGVPDPTLTDFRSDYKPYPLANQIKNEIAGRKNQPGGAPLGRVGIIGFSFYELYEDKLRPLEIDGQSGDRCVFPSAETIASELYPLERTLRLYTTQRSLNRQEVQNFLRFYLKRSERRSNDNQLIPVSDAVRRQELARIDDPSAYGDAGNGGVSEPSPDGTVATTDSTDATGSTAPTTSGAATTPGTPSGSGVQTTPAAPSQGSAPPAGPSASTTTTTQAAPSTSTTTAPAPSGG